jgi:hypothetical protein
MDVVIVAANLDCGAILILARSGQVEVHLFANRRIPQQWGAILRGKHDVDVNLHERLRHGRISPGGKLFESCVVQQHNPALNQRHQMEPHGSKKQWLFTPKALHCAAQGCTRRVQPWVMVWRGNPGLRYGTPLA